MKVKTVILPEILESKLFALKELCAKKRVKAMWAIGSVLTNKFRNNSDIDLVYELDEASILDKEYLLNLDGLIQGLMNLFSGRELDLIDYSALKNPYFIEEVDETKVLLYGQDTKKVPV
ncbi:MAG: nucleotidyltransferase domain-containing protein [Bacteroidota bacterium]